jgi:parallel beta-helix repeat protein
MDSRVLRPAWFASVVAGVLLTLSPELGATTFYVRTSGNDGNAGTSPTLAWASIRTAAQRVANPGDKVVVGPGRYLEGDISPARSGVATFPISFAADSPGTETGDQPGQVLIDVGMSADTGFLILGTSDIVVSGFYVTGARIAGIQVRADSSNVQSNRVVVADNVLFSNGASVIGRGIQVEDSSGVQIFNNLVYANASVGISVGGTSPGSSNARVINNTVYGNPIAGIVVGAGNGSVSPGAWLINNITAQNGVGVDTSAAGRCEYIAAYNLVSDGYGDTTPRDPTDLHGDPQFVEPAGPDGLLGGTGYVDDDFALASQPAGQTRSSPAIDAGAGLASTFGLEAGTTRSDDGLDTGSADLGFHRVIRDYQTFTAVPIPPFTLYVRVTGSDANDGLEPSRALRSVGRAATIARAKTRIVVGPGTYPESDIGVPKLAPAGPVEFVADPSGMMTGDSVGPVLVDAGGSDTGFLIEGRCAELIDGFVVTNALSAGIQVRGGSNRAVVENNTVFSNAKRGIQVDASDDVQISNNLVYANGTGGIQVGGNPGSARAIVQNNTCYLNGQNGIQIGTAGAPSPAARIRFNIMQGNGKNGIQLDDNDHIGVSQPGYTAQYNVNADRYGSGTPDPVSDLKIDPLLTDPSGPDGLLGGDGFRDDDFHLSQLAAGQSIDSLAVDYAPVTAKSVALDRRSTRTDTVPDTDKLDLGYHYPAGTEATIYVSPDGSDSYSGLSIERPLLTVGQALRRTRAGNRVELASGVYHESNLRPSAGVLVTGALNAVAVVDAGGGSTAFDLREPGTSLVNVAITGASSAGVRLRADGVQVVNCRVFSNPDKGVLVAEGHDGVIFNNLIYANGNNGVTIGTSSSGTVRTTVAQNTIVNNTGRGVAVAVASSAPSTESLIINNVIASNRRSGVDAGDAAAPTLVVSHNCNSDGYAGIAAPVTDIGKDPMLRLPIGAPTASDDGFYLAQSVAGEATTSPCVDAGLGSIEQIGLEQTWTRSDGQPDRGWLDIGYHHGLQLPNLDEVDLGQVLRDCANTCTEWVGDCDGDGNVTVDELILGVGIILGNELVTDCPTFDRNGDGQITVDELVRAVTAALLG